MVVIRKKPGKPAKPAKVRPGWLLLTVGDVEVGMAPGKAVHLAAALCPDDEAPTVDEVRALYPDPILVGTTADGQPVSLRSLVAPDADDDDGDV